MPQQHGTSHVEWELGQQNEVLVAVVRAMPQALQEINPKQLLAFLEGRGQVLERVLREMFTALLIPVVPSDDEWFELTVDYGVDPAEVVRSAGYDHEGWTFLGPTREGREIHHAKLVRLGRGNMAEVEQRADEQGYRLLGGHAREPFKTKFPRCDDRDPVVFGGSQWRNPHGSAYVTYLLDVGGGWYSSFRWSEHDFHEYCRWAVVSK